MAKKSKKQRKSKGASRPNLSPLTMLRPRLDGLMNNPEWLDRSDDEIMADIATVVRTIEDSDYLPIMARAVNSTTPEVSSRLNQLIPNWLSETDNVEILLNLLHEDGIGTDIQPLVKEWLAQAGVDSEELHKERESTFCEAHYGADEFGSQGILFIFWYTNRSRNRVSGVSLLVDFNPPWDGATKEQYILPQMSPRDMKREILDEWNFRIPLEELDGAEAKAKFAEVLQCNIAQDIRLHQDLIPERAKVIDHVLSLPDAPDAPTISVSEFETLCHQGQKPEQLMWRERTMGRQIRTADGKEMTVVDMRSGEEDDWL